MRTLIPPLASLPLDEPWDTKTRKLRKRIRKPTLASVAKQAAKAGIGVARFEVDPDGKIVVVTKSTARNVAVETSGDNEWDVVLQ